MWEVVFQPFWISGRSGQESFLDTSEKERRENKEWLMTPSRCYYCLSKRLSRLTCFLYRCSHESHKEKKINSIARAFNIRHRQIFSVRSRPRQRLMDLFHAQLTVWQNDGSLLQHSKTVHEASQVSFGLRPKTGRTRILTSCQVSVPVGLRSWRPRWEFSFLSACQLFQSLPGDSVEPEGE